MPNRVGCIVLGITGLVIAVLVLGIGWFLLQPPLRPGLTEEDIPVLKDRAFFACQDDAWDIYGVGVRFDADEAHYSRFYNRVEMDVRVGGRPMECTTFFKWDAPLVIENALVTPRD